MTATVIVHHIARTVLFAAAFWLGVATGKWDDARHATVDVCYERFVQLAERFDTVANTAVRCAHAWEVTHPDWPREHNVRRELPRLDPVSVTVAGAARPKE